MNDADAKVIKRAFFGLLLLAGCATPQFTNPVGSGQAPDPFVCRDADTDSYYLLFTRGKDLCVFRSKTLANVRDGESKVIYEPRDEDGIYGHIWAPEMHKAPNGKWYVYTSGAMRKNEHWECRGLYCNKRYSLLQYDRLKCYNSLRKSDHGKRFSKNRP